ncbi:MAG TPA: Ig-like domain-containing protein [Rhodocyclaceae bacterium]|nr:Ig-like domain-containing protein [Rhodocyclaceae bacterium]
MELARGASQGVAYSADGTLAYVAGAKGQVYLVDLSTNEVAYTFDLASTARINSLVINDNWMYVAQSDSATGSGALSRIYVDQQSSDFLTLQQTLRLPQLGDVSNFVGLAINNDSYLGITASGGGNGNAGTVAFVDINQIEADGKVPASAVKALDNSLYPRPGMGKLPTYIASGRDSGQFIVCNRGDMQRGLVGITLGFDDSGQINAATTISLQSTKLDGHVPNTYLGYDAERQTAMWGTQKTYHEDIQAAAGAVVVDYDGEQYAIVSDFNLWFNDPLVAQYLNDVPHTQIGGKVGVIKNPFGANGQPPVYLGATTPIVGSAVRRLSLAADGSLFADVWNYEPNLDLNAAMSYSLYVWNAPKLIQGAINAYQRDPQREYPIDRDLPSDPTSSQAAPLIPALTPARYDDAGNGQAFSGWMNLGSYAAPGRFPTFGRTAVPEPKLVAVPKEPVVPLTAGLDGALGWVVSGINLLTGGYMQRADQRVYKYHTGQLSKNEMQWGNAIDFATTTAAFVVSGSLASGATIKLTQTGWRAVAEEMALRGAAMGEVFNLIEQAGANVIYVESGGRDGHLGISLREIAQSTVIGAGLGGALGALGGRVAESDVQETLRAAWRWLANKVDQSYAGLQAESRNTSIALTREVPAIIEGATEISYNGLKFCETPKRGTLAFSEAEAWYAEQVRRLADWLAKSPVQSLEERLLATYQLRAQLREGAKASLLRQEFAEEFLASHPLPPIDRLKAELRGKFSGNALKEAELRELQTADNPCFVAGTPVWTDKGLVPIEKIQVGDMVLSKSEATGEKAFKRVMRTFRKEHQEIRTICADGAMNEDGSEILVEFLFATPEHPFWVDTHGWVTAGELWDCGARYKVDTWAFDRADGRRAGFFNEYGALGVPVYVTANAQFVYIGQAIGSDEDAGYTMRFDGNTQVDSFDPFVYVDRAASKVRIAFQGATFTGDDLVGFSDTDGPPTATEFRTTVFNIEVEDFHTYFVGELGLWVHNTCAPKVAVGEATNPNRATELPAELYVSRPEIRGAKEASDYALEHGLFGKLMLVKVKRTGSAEAEAWDRGTFGSMVEKDNPSQALEIYATFKNEFAINGRKLEHGRAYEGIVVQGDRVYLIDRKLTTMAHLGKYPGSATTAIPKNLEVLMRDSQAIKALDTTFKAANSTRDAAAVYSFGPTEGASWKAAVDEMILPLLNKEYVGNPALQGIFRIKFPAGKNSPEVPVSLEQSNALLDEIAQNIISEKILIVTDKGVVRFELKDGRYVNAGFNSDNTLLSTKTSADFQLVEQLGVGAATTLSDAEVLSLLPTVREYWLDTGASNAVLASVDVRVGDLPAGVAGATQGNQITLSASGAGWGWYVDPNPADSSEFIATETANDFVAAPDSPAAGKLDLLTVLIHEMGHALGLEHSLDGHDEMAGTVSPGLRRLPVVDANELLAIGFASTITNSTRTSITRIAPSPNYAVAANPKLSNTEFAGGQDWATSGDVAFVSGASILKETGTVQTRLNQAFVLGEHDRFLSFTVSDMALDDVDGAPDDAFEVALIDANTGLSLLGGTGLSHNDAVLNLQADGSEHAAGAVTSVRNADGSRTYLIDLAGIAAGTVVNLSFDLIGFGKGAAAASSHVTIRDLRLGVPQTQDDAVTLAEDTPTAIAALDNDLNAQQPGFVPVVVDGPAHGQVTLHADGTFHFTPDKDWSGQDSFTYRLSDGHVDSNVATVSLTVTPVNDAPVTADDQASLQEDSAPVAKGNVLANDSDVDAGTVLTVAEPGIFAGTYGTLQLAADGTYTYTLANETAVVQALRAGETVTDVFAYAASDGITTTPARLTVTVTGQNDAPVTADDGASVKEDGTLVASGNLLANDSDVDSATVLQVAAPGRYAGMYGTLEIGSDGSYTYVLANDTAGVQALRAGEIVTDVFAYAASDGITTTPGTLTIAVTGANDAPVAADDAAGVQEDGALVAVGNVLANDSDIDTGTVLSVAQPGDYVGAYGTLRIDSDGNYRYTLANDSLAVQALRAGEVVTETFAYAASDGITTTPAQLVITITGQNDAPVTADDRASVREDGVLVASGNVLGNDTDVDAGAVLQVVAPGRYAGIYGTLSVASDGSYTYTLANDSVVVQALREGEVVTDVFAYQASDGMTATPAQLTITITGENDAPVTADDVANVQEDGTTVARGNLLANDRDVDTDTSLAVAAPGSYVGAYGTLVVDGDGWYTYTLANDSAAVQGLRAGQVVADVFVYAASDGVTATPATLTIQITGSNDGPVARDDVRQAQEDGGAFAYAASDLLANDTDVDRGDSKTIVSVTDSAAGAQVRLVDGQVVYDVGSLFQHLKEGQRATDTFSYTIADGEGATSTATVTVTVVGVNDAPVARDDLATLDEDGRLTLALMGNDADIDGDALTLKIANQPAHGTLALNADNTVTYTPVENWSGEDSFTYVVNDGLADSLPATVRLIVAALADAPTLVVTDRPGEGREVFRTGWESVRNKNSTSTLVQSHELEGWTLLTRPDPSSGGSNGFEIWSSGDKMMDAGNRLRTVSAMAGNGANWLELNNSGGHMHQTLGLERSVDTVAGAAYTLSLDLAGRLGYSAEYTRIGIYVDGVRIGGDGSVSPATALAWQTRTFQFTGTGSRQTIRIVSEATKVDKDGRGMMIDDICLTETLPANTGLEDSSIRISAISATLKDTDGSETLALAIEALPVGATLTDGSHSFTASAGATTADITGWNLGQLAVTPPKDFNGTLTLKAVAVATERANNDVARVEAQIRVTVLAVNDAPVARDVGMALAQGESARIDFAQLATDPDGDVLTLSIREPRYGSLTRNADGTYTYTPRHGFTGTDSFTYTVSDGQFTATGTITLTVQPKPRDDDRCHDDHGHHTGFSHSEHLGYHGDGERSACITVWSGVGGSKADDRSLMNSGKDHLPSAPAIDWCGCAPSLERPREEDWVLDFFSGKRKDNPSLADLTGLKVKSGK